MIPNPKKNVTVDFTTDEIKSVLIKIPTYFGNKYTLDKKNEILNQYTYSALEFLSLGVFVDINLNFVTDSKTEIIIEIRRKIGAFDQSIEVQRANQHIENLFNGISVLLSNVRKASIEATVEVDVENPSQIVKYDLSWKDVKRHLTTFLSTYPNTYKLVSENNTDEIVLRRLPQNGDDVVLNIDAILKIKNTSSNENSSAVLFVITNDKNKISTQGELKRNTLILKITINLLQKIIDTLTNKILKAETELENIMKWKIGRSDAKKQEQIDAQQKLIEELKQELKSS